MSENTTQVNTGTLNELARLIHLLNGKDPMVNDVKYALSKLIADSDAKTIEILNTRLKFKQGLGVRSKTLFIVLHHADSSSCTIQDIHKWHLAKGWAGCGYHFFVSKDGKVYEGRPSDAVGAQCEGSNAISLGICFEGDYSKDELPDIQKSAGLNLIRYVKTLYPGAKVRGHKELFATECPGKNFPLDFFKVMFGDRA